MYAEPAIRKNPSGRRYLRKKKDPLKSLYLHVAQFLVLSLGTQEAISQIWLIILL